MSARTNPKAIHPLSGLVSAIMVNEPYANSDLYTHKQWSDAAQCAVDGDYSDIETMAARDMAASECPVGDTYNNGPDFDTWFAPNESYFEARAAMSYEPAVGAA